MVLSVRQRLEVLMLVFLSFVSFASYHAGTGSTTWIMWTTLVVFAAFALLFDVAFTDASSFVFDPDADNWRKKTDKGH